MDFFVYWDCNFMANELSFETKVANDSLNNKYEKENKSERRMPWLSEARKDVVSCDKLRGSANRN